MGVETGARTGELGQRGGVPFLSEGFGLDLTWVGLVKGKLCGLSYLCDKVIMS